MLKDATSIGSSRDHKPVPSERKSGMPDGVEMPAPVSTTARFALRNNSAASSIAVMRRVPDWRVRSSGKRLSFGDEIHKFCDLPGGQAFRLA